MGDTALTLPFGPAGSLAIMSSRAAGQAAYDIAQRGGTGAEAFFGGAAAGAIEYFTEKIPIGRLFDVAESGVKFFSKQGLKNILKQAGIEGTEEWVSEVLNNFTDYAIMGDRSNLGLKIKDLMSRGMSEQKARKNAFSEFFVLNPLEAAAGGAISGGVFAAGANAVSHIKTDINEKTMQQPGSFNQLVANQQNIPANIEQPIINSQEGQTQQQKVYANIEEQNAQNVQAKNGDVLPHPPTRTDPNETSPSKVQAYVIDTAREMQALAEETQTKIYNDSVKNAYYQFRTNPTNANAESFYNTAIQNIDMAIAAEQQVGADRSVLAEFKGRMESAKSEAGQAQPDVEAQAKRTTIERNMTKAVSALTNLPAGVQAGAEAQAARQALYDYLKADESGKAAAYNKAAQQLNKNISSALAAEGLDAGTRQALEGALDNIDRRGEIGDNREQGRIGEPEDVTRNIVDTQGARNEQPLTKKQYDELVSHVIEFGFPKENIAPYNPDSPFETGLAYGNRLYINNDALPSNTPDGSPNSQVSGRGTMAHEIIGHYETIQEGTAFKTQYYDISGAVKTDLYYLALDEAQASIRAARFAPGLTDSDRLTLIKDAIMRLNKQRIKIRDVRRLLDILER